MIIGFDFIDDNAVHWAGKLVFQPGASTFIVYYHQNLNPSNDVRADGYWTRITGVFDLKDRWGARVPSGADFQLWVQDNIFQVPISNAITFWDNVNVPGGTFTPIGWRAKQENYDAFATFLAQPRIKDPCKGWSSEELQGPYTNATDIFNLSVDALTRDNFMVRPRALMCLTPAVTVQFYMNDQDQDGGLVTIGPDIPIGTIIPIRPIGTTAGAPSGAFLALW